MLKNYFKIALRNLKRKKAYTLVNILGLTLGIVCAILIFALVKYHLSFDTFHTKKERIYRVVTEEYRTKSGYNAGVPPPLGRAIRNDYASVEKAARVAAFGDILVTVPFYRDGLKFQEEEGVAFAEPEFFDIMDFPLLKGDRHTLLTEPNTAAITEHIARKYFNGENPIGQTIRLTNRFTNQHVDFRVAGILRDLPVQTDRRQEIYLSYRNLEEFHPAFHDKSWSLTSRIMQCFVLLKPGTSPDLVNSQFPDFSKRHYGPRHENFQFRLQPLSDIHFNTSIDGKVDKKNLLALSLIGFFLIITACVNFINLATAHALARSREIGIRKALGGYNIQLFWQFITETALIATVAMVVAFLLAQLVLPSMNRLFDTQLRINIFRDGYLLGFLVLLLVLVTLLSGSYPGLVLARVEPVLALRGKLRQQHVGGGLSVRKGLVVVQFAISQLLIIGTIVVANQMRYSRQADMGFQKEAIVMLPVPFREQSAISALNARLSQVTGVEGLTFCSEEPAGNETFSTNILYDARDKHEDFDIYFKAGDYRYVPTFGLQLLAGRNLYRSDTSREYLLNETAVRKLGIATVQEVIGKHARINGRNGEIVGVVKDFHNKSFHEAINPLCITTGIDWYGRCAVKINPAALKSTLAAIEDAWNSSFPGAVYKYDFVDERIARFYKLDEMLLRLINTFSLIAIIIGCLGLYGLVSYMAAQRTREVGVRKALGASVQSILWLFGKDFIRLLLIAFVIAAPLAWWAMNNWLENFVYRIQIGLGIFVLAVLVTFAVAVLSVGYRSVKAALANPIKSLRSE